MTEEDEAEGRLEREAHGMQGGGTRLEGERRCTGLGRHRGEKVR